MFKKIKEFIEAFTVAYNTINVNKIDAKIAIEDYSKEADYIIRVVDSLKIIFTHLEAIYSCFPIKERQDFVIKTLDLLRYGRLDSAGDFKDVCGLVTLYSSQANYVNIHLKDLNKLYKKGKYDEVMAKAKEYSNRLEEFYVLYDIKENTVKENE